jgi:hypothetical protein
MIQLQIGTTILHGIWNSLQVEEKPTKHSLIDFLRVSLMSLFQFSLKCFKKLKFSASEDLYILCY